jgi:L-lactate permease
MNQLISQFVWLVLAWIGGTAAILGSLMTIGCLILWIAPSQPQRVKKTDRQQSAKQQSANPTQPWQNKLKLTIFSLAIAIAGFSLLVAFPFPIH